MPPKLTPQQEKKLKKLYAVIEQGDVAILNHLFELEQTFEDKANELKAEFASALKELKTTIPNIQDVLNQVKGKDSSPEDVASILRSDESFMQALKPEDGVDGKDYMLTEQDKKEIASSIKVPIVEKIIEKTDIIHEQPILKTEIVKETTVIEKSDETGEDIVNKINDLPIEPEKQIAVEHIKGWKDLVKNGKSVISNSGIKRIVAGTNITVDNTNLGYPVISSSGGGGVVSASLLTGAINSQNLSYTSSASPTASSKTTIALIDSDNQTVVTYLEDVAFTRSGGNVTFLKAIDAVYSSYRLYLIYT